MNRYATEVYRKVVSQWRAPRDTPRPDLQGFPLTNPGVWEDPAPEWACRLGREVCEHIGSEPDHGEGLLLKLLRWCDEGDPEARSAQVVGLVQNWIGPRVLMLRQFLANARKTGGGAQKKDRPIPLGGLPPRVGVELCCGFKDHDSFWHGPVIAVGQRAGGGWVAVVDLPRIEERGGGPQLVDNLAFHVGLWRTMDRADELPKPGADPPHAGERR